MEPHPAGATTFIARDPELDLLRRQLEAARSGSGGVVLLAGEPGIGKTRTAEELAAKARACGALVLWGRCYEGEGAPAFWPWVQILRSYVRERDVATLRLEMGPGAADIAQIVAEVQERLRQPPAPLQDPAQARFRLFDSITAFFGNATNGTRGRPAAPLLLILDDLHWADVPSLLLLQFIAREAHTMRLLVVGTYRDEEVHRQHPLAQVLADLPRQPHVQRVVLRGFTEPDVACLVALTAGVQLPESSVTALAKWTDGNPFFVTEAVRLLASEGRLGQVDVAAAGGRGVAVPQRVREVINRRLDRLSPACNRVLTIAAVLGRDFSLGALGRVSELAGEPLLDVLEEAETARLIAQAPPTVGRYQFTHALIRECLYEELPTTRRIRLHRLVGEALETLQGPDGQPHLAELAYHFVQAAPGGEVEKAVAYSRRAAERATAILAYEDAVGHYQRALDVLELKQQADPRECGELLLALGEAQCRAGERDAAKETFRRAAAVARSTPAPDQLARAALAYGGTLLTAGVVDPVLLDLLGQARTALGDADSTLAARVLARLAMEYYYADARDRRLSLSEEAVEMARRLGDPATLAFTLSARRVALWAPEHIDERLALGTEMLQLAEAAGDRDLAAHGHHVRLVDLLELGEIAAVDRELAAHARIAEDLRDPLYLWHTDMWRAMRAMLDGRLEEAEALVQQAFALGQRTQTPNVLMVYGAQILALRREQGRAAELAPATARFADQFPSLPAWRAALAALYSDLGSEAEARREFDRLAEQGFAGIPRDGLWLTTVTLLTEVCAFLGDHGRAVLLYDLLLPYGRHTAIVNNGVVCTGSVARYLGLLAGTMARWQEAAAHYEAALAMNARLGARPSLAHTQHEYATMLLAHHDAACGGRDAECTHPSRAQQLLEPALTRAGEMGMARLAEQVQQALAALEVGALGGPAGTVVTVSLPDGLTAREVEVLRLLASGQTNREIAQALYVSVPTVERHLANLYAKIGARRRADAAAYAVQRGLGPDTAI